MELLDLLFEKRIAFNNFNVIKGEAANGAAPLSFTN